MNRISDLLLNWAERSPDANAILTPEQPGMSYGRLAAQTRDVVAQLNALGIGHHDRVAIVLPNGPEMATAFLSVASCAVSAPLNPAFNTNEFEFYLSDLDAKALIVKAGDDSPARDVARAHGIAVINLTPDAEAGRFILSGEPNHAAKQTGLAQADDIALILHTSGTTSRPKMVPLTHRNLCASAQAVATTLQLTTKDRCLNVMPLFHIHGLVAAVLSPMASGGSLICLPGFSADGFYKALAADHPSWYTAVPTIHQAILAAADPHQDIITQQQLRFIRSSSASLPPSVMTDLEKVFDAPVIEAYGMTEAAHQMVSNPLPPQNRKLGSVGIAAGPEVAIMEEDGSGLLLQGKTGEIVIRGGNVTAGYENNPEANKTAFTKDWFHTGDQGYFDVDGYLFITGRLKEIINRGGEKITPREVDEALLSHPAISQAVTFAIPHDTLGEDVAAAVILKKAADTSEQDLRQYVFSHLADFKVPSRILIVDAIPKGATGKLQRIGLAEKLSSELTTAHVAPKTETQQTIANIIEDILGCRLFGITNNFFVSGGDSLKGIQVINRINQTFLVELPNTAIFRFPTIEALAEEIMRMQNEMDELTALANQLQQLPPEEVEQLLREVDRPSEASNENEPSIPEAVRRSQ